MAAKPTPADIAKRKKMMEQKLRMKDPALTKKPSLSTLIEKPKSKASTAGKIAKTVKKVMVDPTSVLSKATKSKASKQLTGDKAAEAMRKRTSPKGVKEYEKGAKKAKSAGLKGMEADAAIEKALKNVATRMRNDRQRTASRGEAIVRREKKKRMNTDLS